MLTSAQWQQYRNVVNQASESFNQDTIIWRRHTRGFQRYGEDTGGVDDYTNITLNCLIAYNIFRTWPMSKETVGGQLDDENIVLVLNKKYLEDLGYLNSDEFFEMDPGKDQFIHRGIEYRSGGETEVAQAGDKPLMFYIMLSRKETPTGIDKY